ncbi:MAG: T9SS type A sorting domain-containing protein [Parcubacteria group bacterium]|nr:T9SS type A sorting domain-containing protein [Parcubacteria group bacterium]
MKRTIAVFLAGALFLLGSGTASAAPRYLYEFPWQPANKGLASFFQQVGIASPPAIPTDQEISLADTTMVLETGTYDTVYVRSGDVVLYHGVEVTGMLTVEPGAYILPADKDAWLNVTGVNATATIGAPGGEFVQILGVGVFNPFPNTKGIQVLFGAAAVMHNVLTAGVGRGTVVYSDLDDAVSSLQATRLYMTNNGYGAAIMESNVELAQSAIWDNSKLALFFSDGSRKTSRHFRATESWFSGQLDLSLGNRASSIVFDRCILPDGFVDWLYSGRDNPNYTEEAKSGKWDYLIDFSGYGDLRDIDLSRAYKNHGLDRVTVLESRPLGTVQVHPLEQQLLAANFTGSGDVNDEDIRLWAEAFGSPRDSVAFGNLYDLNRDGMVNMPDMEELAYAFAGLERSQPATALGASPKLPEFLAAVTRYPAVVSAAESDPVFGPLIQAYMAPTVVAEVSGETPNEFSLENYPNPFNSGTTIRFQLPKEADVVLTVYNVNGQVVARLVDERLQAGAYTQTWDGLGADGNSVSTGTYFYRLNAGDYTHANKMTLLR